MIANKDRSIIVSSLGWVDKDSLWIFHSRRGEVTQLSLGSGASYASLQSSGTDYFAVAHHFRLPELNRLKGDSRDNYEVDQNLAFAVTVRAFAEPATIVASAKISPHGSLITGDHRIWESVPRIYNAYLWFAPWQDHVMIIVTDNGAQIQKIAWYDETYDKGYQGIVQVCELPATNMALVSVQRSSKVVLHDLRDGTEKGTINLGGHSGNPSLFLRQHAEELWATDYKVLASVDRSTWQPMKQINLEERGHFIGDFDFDPGEQVCVVARPFQNDVVAIDPNNYRQIGNAKFSGQPLDVAWLPGNQIIARDWKTGSTEGPTPLQ